MSIRYDKLENQGVISLVMIEVQNREYLGEDDLIRFPADLSDLSVN